MDIILASQNLHKKEELSSIIDNHRVLLPKDQNIDFFYDETGSSYMENAFGKAKCLFEISGKPVIADDSGLSIPALNGEPGIYSARYGSVNQKNLSAEERNDYLLDKLKNVKDRTAFFVCCMVLLIDNYRFFVIQETVTGKIMEKSAGHNGFGYDPVFYLPDYDKTMAELSPEIKNKISHRGKAGNRIKKILDTI